MVYQRKWYAVTVGKRPGVYSSWIEAAPNTRNIPGGAIHQGFSSEMEAYRAFNAARARGEVRAYPDVKSDLDEDLDDAPLSPLGGEAALLRTPMDVKLEEDSRHTGLQTPVHSRVAQLRRTLQQTPDPVSTSSSPATHVTQVNPSLFDDDDVPRSTPVLQRVPHLTFDSGSLGAYPSISGAYTQVQLDISDGSSFVSPEHNSRTPRSMRLHPESPSRTKGVKFRSLSDLEETENLDARIWLPIKSPVFSPENVKRWPKSRSPSPTKKSVALPRDEAVGDKVALADASFVRAGRGRHARLTPSMSVPIFPNRELEDDCAGPTHARIVNIRAKDIDFSLSDTQLARRKNYTESHAQTIPSEDAGQSSIMVHCSSASCVHAGSGIGFVHVPHRSISPDLDVRSPLSKGALVPLSAAEALFGRPSPHYHSWDA